jgi:hypothetical protein
MAIAHKQVFFEPAAKQKEDFGGRASFSSGERDRGGRVHAAGECDGAKHQQAL